MFMFQTKTDISIIRPHTHKLVHYYAISSEPDCSVSMRMFPSWNTDPILIKSRSHGKCICYTKSSLYISFFF